MVMGKRKPAPGLPKHNTKKQLMEIEARAMLLGAVFDKASNMLIKTERGNGGQAPWHWTTYFNVNGVELPLREAKRRLKAADKRRLGLLSQAHKYGAWINEFSSGLYAGKLAKHLGVSENLRIMDELKQEIINATRLPQEVTEEIKHEKSKPRNQCNDTVRIARLPSLRQWR